METIRVSVKELHGFLYISGSMFKQDGTLVNVSKGNPIQVMVAKLRYGISLWEKAGKRPRG